MWDLDYKESWVLKDWCFWTVMLEKTLESPLDWKEMQPVHPKGNQSRIFIGRTDAEAETPILWPPDAKNWLIGKDPDVGKDWRWEEKGMTEDEMVGWHHLLNGHGFGWTPGVGDGQGGLTCWVANGQTWLSDWTELNWTFPQLHSISLFAMISLLQKHWALERFQLLETMLIMQHVVDPFRKCTVSLLTNLQIRSWVLETDVALPLEWVPMTLLSLGPLGLNLWLFCWA